MATYVNDLRLKEIATGDESGTWGTSTNTNLELIAEAFSFGTEAISTNASTHTTTIADGSTDPGRSIYLQYTGTLNSTCTITIGPNTVSKLWFIENATSGSQSIIIKQGSGATVTIRNGDVKAIYSDGAGSGGKMVDAFTDLHVNGLTSEVDGNTAALTVRSTDADASVGPLIVFDRESSSPADDDLVGRLVFQGQNDASEGVTYGRIQTTIKDASDGTEDGLLQLASMLDGTVVSRMEMNATETVFNDGSKDLDFRIESDSSTKKFFVDGGNDVVCINTDSPRGIASTSNREFQMEGTSGVSSSFSITRNQNNNGGGALYLAKTRGTAFGAVTIVQDGDTLGAIGFAAADGTDVAHQAASIGAEVDGTPGANDVPGRIVFKTTPDGSTTLGEVMRINQSGAVLINTTTDYGGKVNIKSDASGNTVSTLALVSTLASAADGPILDLNRQTASPADSDNIGLIRFKSTNSADPAETVRYAEIDTFTQDVTDGTEDGMIRIRTILNGTLRSRIEFDQTETVINEDSQNLDFRVESDGNANMFFIDGGLNRIRIGNETHKQIGGAAKIVGIATNGGDSGIVIARNSDGSGAGSLGFGKSRGTSDGAVTVVQDGDSLGSVYWAGADGTDLVSIAASISGQVDGTPGSNDMPGRLVFSTTSDGSASSTERMRIDSNGCVMINRTTAVADDMTAGALHVGINATTTSPTMIVDDGDSSVEANSIVMAVMFSNDNSFSEAKYISFRDLGGEQGSVTGTGNGSVSFNTSSDVRLKTNIQDTASQWDTIKALQVRDYEWIGNGNEETGFIAQELHEQIPQVVRVGGEEAAKQPWAVDYGRITPQLTKALQEAMARIETLETELAKLKEGGS